MTIYELVNIIASLASVLLVSLGAVYLLDNIMPSDVLFAMTFYALGIYQGYSIVTSKRNERNE